MTEDIDMIDIAYNFKPVIATAVKELGENYSLLITSKPKNYPAVAAGIIDLMVNEKKLFGIYLATNKPYVKILSSLKTGLKFDEKKLFFIDCMSEEIADASRAVKANSTDLSELSLSIKHVMQENSKAGFIVLDSLGTLFIDSEEKGVERFARDLIEKAGARKMKTIVLATSTGANAAAIETVSVFFDKVIQAGED